MNTAVQAIRQQQTRQAAVYVGIDDGYAMTKLVASTGKTLKIPSAAEQTAQGVSQVSGAADSPIATYETGEGVKFTVGTGNGEGTRFNDYPFSPMNRAIVHHVLAQAGFGGMEVRIATGLPLNAYFAGDAKNMVAIDRKRENLLRPVREYRGRPVAHVIESEVCAEGLSAWVDFVLNDQGELRYQPDSDVGVVDIGGRTTDCALLYGGRTVDHSRSGSEKVGALDFYSDLRIDLIKKLGCTEDDLSTKQVMKAAEEGRIQFQRTIHDVQSLVENRRRALEDRIVRTIERIFDNRHNSLDAILFVGGGSVVFKNVRTRFDKGFTVEAPEFANARGMLKYLQFVK